MKSFFQVIGCIAGVVSAGYTFLLVAFGAGHSGLGGLHYLLPLIVGIAVGLIVYGALRGLQKLMQHEVPDVQ